MKLLILADDFTGALDTGVQLTKFGASARVVTDVKHDMARLFEDCDVLVIDTETRHAKPEAAREAVRQLAAQASRVADVIYKKTDSAMRGNIGAELEGVLEGVENGKTVHFAPAYPALNRLTHDGVQYVDGLPVSQSVFGQDPFEPVRYSNVCNAISSQSGIRVQPVTEREKLPIGDRETGILVYDATGEERLKEIAESLVQKEHPLILAGCAGFAAHLKLFLDREDTCEPIGFPAQTGLMVVSGSMNPITSEQIAVARRDGFGYVSVDSGVLLSDYESNEEMERLIGKILEQFRTERKLIVEVNGAAQENRMGWETDPQFLEQGHIIATRLGKLVSRLVEEGFDGAILITGGDTLMGVMSAMGVRETHPVCEIESGVVYTLVDTGGKKLSFVTKSGGIGSPNVFLHIANALLAGNDQSRKETLN